MFSPRLPALSALILLATGCARHREVAILAPTPAPPIAYEVPAPPPMSPINRGLSRAAQVWHLRVALNVAALACRGGPELQIIADYNGMIRSRTAELAAVQTALSAEFKARGGDWQDAYDDAMTRLYNFFSQAQARDEFCATAAGVLAEVRTLPAGLDAFADAKLPLLDMPFARLTQPRYAPASVVAVAASAPVYAVAAPRPAAAPRLAVNVTALGE